MFTECIIKRGFANSLGKYSNNIMLNAMKLDEEFVLILMFALKPNIIDGSIVTAMHNR